jgi:hypothetical protein
MTDLQTPLAAAPQPGTSVDRKPYAPPRLTVHGDVRTLTAKQGIVPDQDGGGSFAPDGG